MIYISFLCLFIAFLLNLFKQSKKCLNYEAIYYLPYCLIIIAILIIVLC